MNSTKERQGGRRSVRERGVPAGFKAFWDAYGLKRDRIAAERAWQRLSSADRRAAVCGIAAYREDCQRRRVSMMYAQGYLNHRRWEDVLDEPPAAAAPPPALAEMEVW